MNKVKYGPMRPYKALQSIFIDKWYKLSPEYKNAYKGLKNDFKRMNILIIKGGKSICLILKN